MSGNDGNLPIEYEQSELMKALGSVSWTSDCFIGREQDTQREIGGEVELGIELSDGLDAQAVTQMDAVRIQAARRAAPRTD